MLVFLLEGVVFTNTGTSFYHKPAFQGTSLKEEYFITDVKSRVFK